MLQGLRIPSLIVSFVNIVITVTFFTDRVFVREGVWNEKIRRQDAVHVRPPFLRQAVHTRPLDRS